MKRGSSSKVSGPAKRAAGKRSNAKRSQLVSKNIFRTLPLSRNVGKYTTGFPKQMFMRHKYIQNFLISATAGSLGTFQISVNALFDPDNSGATTHQPFYFDQVAALYNKYVVLASKATVTFYQGSTAAYPMLVGAYIEDDATITPITAVACSEQASAQFRFLPNTSANNPYQLTNQITLRWDAKKAFGGDVIDNPNLVASVTANPTEQQYFTFFAQDGLATPAGAVAIQCSVVVEYSAQYFELKNIDPS